jgi:hypothetical protein
MSPQAIALIVSVATLVGTLAVQVFGILKTSKDNKKTGDQRDDRLEKKLKDQSDRLDKTLKEQRTRTLNERFATAADMLDDDKGPAVQLAGVYAMAGLADDWKEEKESQQTCISVPTPTL